MTLALVVGQIGLDTDMVRPYDDASILGQGFFPYNTLDGLSCPRPSLTNAGALDPDPLVVKKKK